MVGDWEESDAEGEIVGPLLGVNLEGSMGALESHETDSWAAIT